MKKIINIFAILIFTTPWSLHAESWYQVEVIVFDRINPDFGEEKWSSVQPSIRPDMLELYSNDETNSNQQLVPFMIMDKKNNRMNGIHRVLRLSKEYRPLIHLSWQQPATERDESRYIHIIKRNDDEKLLNQSSSNDFNEPDFLEELVFSKKIIDGSIRIRSGFLLHVDVELYYFSDMINDSAVQFSIEASNQLIIGLSESRKIKLDEIHYFDNPIYGLILQVSRLENVN